MTAVSDGGPGKTGAHVGLVVNSYPPRLGGLESHVFQLANELRSAGAKVTVITLASEDSIADEAGVRVIRRRMYLPIASVISFPRWGTTRRLSRMFDREGITVVSTHTRFFPMSYVGVRAARRSGLPAIHTEHGAGFVKTPSALIQWGSRLVDLTMGRAVLRQATRVLAVSAPAAAFVERLARVRPPVFNNALSLDEWPAGESTAAPTGIAFLGRLVAGKGWEKFIDVAAELIIRRGFTNLAVHVLGAGPDAEALRRRIRARGIEQSVELHGHADAPAIQAALAGSVLVNPSQLAEGFQITLLEAAATGAQIVSYPVPSVEPLLADGAPIRQVSGLSLGALVDSVEQALTNPLPPMSRDVLDAHWSWRVRAQEYLEIVDEVTRGRA